MATHDATRRRRMPTVGVQVETADPFVLRLPKAATLRVSAAMFERICGENPELRLERTATGGLIVMAPAGGEAGGSNFVLNGRLFVWCEANPTGKGFDSSTGFMLPNGALRSPDAAWVAMDRWLAVPSAERQRFAPICPDFVVELRSSTDRLPAVRRNMREYIDQGARLGWLIDPILGKVGIYRPGREPEVLDRPATLSGEDVLPGFVLDLRGILGE